MRQLSIFHRGVEYVLFSSINGITFNHGQFIILGKTLVLAHV